MLSVEIVVRDFAESVITGIKERIPKSSGKTANTFFWRYDGNRLQIGSTEGWVTVLEDGRRPGKQAPSGEGSDLLKWVQREAPDKTPSEQKSLAFAIARVQAEEGSMLYRAGGKSGVLSDYINQEYVNSNLTTKLKDEIVADIAKILKA